MKMRKNTIQTLTDAQRKIAEHSLVVGIPQPGDCAHGTNNDCDVGDSPNDEDHVAVDRMVSEVVHDLEDKPAGTGNGTSAVDTSQMLRCHSVFNYHSRNPRVDQST